MARHDNLKVPAPPVTSVLPLTNVVPMPVAMNFVRPWWCNTGVRRQVTASKPPPLVINPLRRGAQR
jgi:hypothetical protein